MFWTLPSERANPVMEAMALMAGFYQGRAGLRSFVSKAG
jgi:hypothetical protein